MQYVDLFDNQDELLIKKEIDNSNKDHIHGIMIMHIDNFVMIKGMYGKARGDVLVKEVDSILAKMFRGTDMVVKLRGDEYMIFMSNIKALNNAEFLADKVVKNISGIAIDEESYLSANIGISVYPFHGTDYLELKDKAYQGMYRAKANGKNSFRLHDSARTKALYNDYLYNRDQFDKVNSSEEYFSFDVANKFHEICTGMFKLDNTTDTALTSILELCCLYLGFSRAYIRNTRTAHTIMYANSGYEFGTISATRQAIMDDCFARLKEQYQEPIIIDVEDEKLDGEVKLTMEDDGITQIFYYPIYRNEIYVGACIFENLDYDKVELAEEDLNKFILQFNSIQSYYYTISRGNGSKENLTRLSLFENLDALVYIIDINTHNIEYANRKALKAGVTIGSVCFESIANRQTACVDCPFSKMDPSNVYSNTSIDLYDYTAKQWSRNIFSWVDIYNNPGKVLVIGTDISDLFALKD